MTNYSPLRYPGGKGKLAPYLTDILRLNSLEGGHYAEPFAGGAAVALDLLFSERVKHIHINDIDLNVHSFWHSVIYETDAFVDRILSTKIDVETWLQAREIKRYPESHSPFEVGFAAFFLNRTNRSGILNGGMIGGLDQSGNYKIDCRFNRQDLAERTKRIGLYRSRISLTRLDASDFLSAHLNTIPEKCLVYIDPPYYVKGAFLYQNHYVHQDHAQLASVISEMKHHRWIVSYDNAEQIRRLYTDFEQEQFSINYSARNYAKGTEVMIFDRGLKRPGQVFATQAEQRRYQRAAG
ncbi:DNA adenine methylase [Rhizobium sp. ZW T2_16]|uniref:DNA adenine methylase n=1 Tax=Rhizobium sp. ZW T2_16 TaxID=3378083 RepID=UPI0038553EE5